MNKFWLLHPQPLSAKYIQLKLKEEELHVSKSVTSLIKKSVDFLCEHGRADSTFESVQSNGNFITWYRPEWGDYFETSLEQQGRTINVVLSE